MFLKKFFGVIYIFLSPTEYFAKLKTHPRWMEIFLVIAVVTITVGYLLLPYKQEILLSSLSAKVGEERAQQTLALANQFALIGLLFMPLPLLLKWLVVTVFLYYSSILLNGKEVNFKRIFATLVHTEAILLFASIITLIVVVIYGVQAATNSEVLHTIIGLDFSRKEDSGDIYISTILKNINFFTVWYYLVLSIGLSVASQMEKWKSATIVLLAWILGVCFQIAIKYLTISLQQMMGK